MRATLANWMRVKRRRSWFRRFWFMVARSSALPRGWLRRGDLLFIGTARPYLGLRRPVFTGALPPSHQ
jgi:hypothetical protein